MKRLTLTRTNRQGECTTGILHEGGKVLCYTLEPMWRDLVHEKKVMGRNGNETVPHGGGNGYAPFVHLPGAAGDERGPGGHPVAAFAHGLPA